MNSEQAKEITMLMIENGLIVFDGQDNEVRAKNVAEFYNALMEATEDKEHEFHAFVNEQSQLEKSYGIYNIYYGGNKMKFIDNDHKAFYQKYENDYCKDKYEEIIRARKAAFYLLGIREGIRNNIDKILEFQGNNIAHEGNKLTDYLKTLNIEDQCIVRLAVNLLDRSRVLNNYPTFEHDFTIRNFREFHENEEQYSVDFIFRNAYHAGIIDYFIEAIKLKYPTV